jgi:hypothetical protein
LRCDLVPVEVNDLGSGVQEHPAGHVAVLGGHGFEVAEESLGTGVDTQHFKVGTVDHRRYVHGVDHGQDGRTRLGRSARRTRGVDAGGMQQRAQMLALQLVEPKCPRDGFEHLFGDIGGPSLLQLGVVVDAHAGQDGDLFPP